MTNTTILFVGDVVGDAGLVCLEQRLPGLIAQHAPDFIVVNGENLVISSPQGDCGMSVDSAARLMRLPIDVVTGGNHSWDHPDAAQVLQDSRILRSLNYGRTLPGCGAAIAGKNGTRLGVINAVSKTALPLADEPLDMILAQLEQWHDQVDCALVDFHGESVAEKYTVAFALDEADQHQVCAVLGTHTHVQTNDWQILPNGTAYGTDTGMTGPRGGILGYQPAAFVNTMRQRKPAADAFEFALGEAELGAVVIQVEGRADGCRAVSIERILALG